MTLDQVFRLEAFLEQGKVLVRDVRSGEEDNQSITGGGFGFSISIPKSKDRPGTSFGMSYALPISSGAPSDNSSGTVYANGSISLY